jgi:WD40 repeat protein/tRNA A-37 threonylcarbamoyl transferase component Bud32
MAQPDEQPVTWDPVALLEWVDEVADRFEAAWQSGLWPRIPDYLGGAVGQTRAALVRELATIDLERRRKVGEARCWEDYLCQFPELREPDSSATDLLAAARSAPPLNGCLNWDRQLPVPLATRSREYPRLAGYTILEELGQGGMGTVYKARQLSLNRLVAIKALRSPDLADPHTLTRCRAEAEAVARLEHPNIVHIFEVGEQDGQPYLVLEFVNGGSLARRLGGKPQPPRAAAELVETLARAIHHAHQHGVVHRDLKPANVLLTAEGTPKIADFGLAKVVLGEPGQTLPGTILGSPSYMAPEQAEGDVGEVGPAADVYALGAILYEVLTGRPPFRGASVLETLEQVRCEEPVPPRQLLSKLPRDLETVCLKALARSPARRYPSAGALADDLRRFQNGEPIQARPVGLPERLGRWCRRHPVRAGLAAAVTTLLGAVVVLSVLLALVSTAHERAQRRAALIQQLQVVRTMPHVSGWSAEAWQTIAEAAALGKDDRLRSQAAAVCAGLDARLGRQLHEVSASWVAIDASGTRVLLGGSDAAGGWPSGEARLWDLAADNVRVGQQAGAGPVAFRPDGKAVHLVAGKGPSLLLWDLAGQQPLGECRFAPVSGQPALACLDRNELGLPVLALTREGTLASASAAFPGVGGSVALWEAGTGRLLFQRNQQAGALAFSPAGTLLAGSDPQGNITLWSVPEGRITATLPAAGPKVHCLGFSPEGKRLAVGDGAGTVTVWDVAARFPVAHCRGSHQDVYAVAFSPDGTLLASGGRGPIRLWNAATGRLLLSLPSLGLTTSLLFAPDAGRVIVGSQGPSRVTVWELEEARGIQTLRGLTSQASHLCLSADGRLLAALAHDWQVGIWDLKTGSLRLRLQAPPGGVEDDAALAFSPDDRRLACSAGEGARLWDVDTGAEVGSWLLPPGTKDLLAFHPSGQLLLFRAEEAGRAAPQSGEDNEEAGPDPAPVFQVRNLLGPLPTHPIATITDFNGGLLRAVVTTDGRTLILEGIAQGTAGPCRQIKAYAGPTGAELWTQASRRSAPAASLPLDPTGRLVAVRTEDREVGGQLVEVASGKIAGPVQPFPLLLTPGARALVLVGPPDRTGEAYGYALLRQGAPSSRLVLGIDTTPSFCPVFSSDGDLLAWSNTDGTVSVCHLQEMHERLARVSLEW